MDLQIEGKVALITGADSGLGRATARILASEGAQVILTDLDPDKLEEVVSELQQYARPGKKIKGIAADISKSEPVEKLARQIKDEFGGVNILVNSAGVRGAAGDFLELTDDDWMETIQVDLMGAVRVCRAFIPQMQEKGWGRLVLIASENALQPYEEESPYNACKAGVINLAKCLSRAYSKEGININCVSPAYINTPMTEAMMEELAEERGTSVDEAVQWFLDNKRPHIKVNRRGKPEEVAAVIAFLCSEHASYVFGSNYRVDGGAVESAFG